MPDIDVVMTVKEEENRAAEIRRLGAAMEKLLKEKTGEAIFISCQAALRQYSLDKTLSVSDILMEAYIRGVSKIEKGESILNHSAWFRRTALHIIQEYQRSATKDRKLPDDKIHEDEEPSNIIHRRGFRFNTVQRRKMSLDSIEKGLIELMTYLFEPLIHESIREQSVGDVLELHQRMKGRETPFIGRLLISSFRYLSLLKTTLGIRIESILKSKEGSLESGR